MHPEDMENKRRRVHKRRRVTLSLTEEALSIIETIQFEEGCGSASAVVERMARAYFDQDNGTRIQRIRRTRTIRGQK
jgi:DNA-binding MarR family transcriptional regulator